MPDLLHKRDRGRPTEATAALEPLKYGEVDAKEFVPGAEVLLEAPHKDSVEVDSEDSENEDEWVDINHSSDEGEAGSEVDEDDYEECESEDMSDDDSEEESSEKVTQKKRKQENEDDEEETSEKVSPKKRKHEGEDEKEDSTAKKRAKVEVGQKRTKKVKRTKLERKKEKLKRLAKMKIVKKEEITAEKKAKASQISVERFLTDDDFKRIDTALVQQQVTHAKRAIKKPIQEEKSRGELVKLGDIENIYKKRKHDKQARMDSVKEGQKGRERYGYKDGRQDPHSSKTNREKRKTKAFQMVKHKVRSKTKRSFKDKQIALRNHLIKQKRMK